MTTVELRFSIENPTPTLERLCAELGLILSAPATLASYPGALHWHISKPKLSGTLEATWWPAKQRFWLKVAKNRDAEWIPLVIEEFGREFERALEH